MQLWDQAVDAYRKEHGKYVAISDLVKEIQNCASGTAVMEVMTHNIESFESFRSSGGIAKSFLSRVVKSLMLFSDASVDAAGVRPLMQ